MDRDCGAILRRKKIGAHMGPEISGFPGVHHLLDFGYSLQRRRLGSSFRKMKSHAVKQVIIECHKRSFMKSVMHDTGDSIEALLFPGVGNFFTSGRYTCGALKNEWTSERCNEW
jgi:hypothetical protein